MLYILDRSIDTIGGHQQHQISGIDSLTDSLKFKIITCASEDSDGSFEDGRLIRSLAPRKHRDNLHGDLIEGDENRLMAALDFDPTAECRNLLLPTAHAYDVRLCLAFLRSYEGRARFFLRFLSDAAFHYMSQNERAAMQEQITRGNIKVVTETSGMVDLLDAKHGIKATADLLLPCSISTKTPILNSKTDPVVFKIGYLGGPRPEKGYDRIPEIISAICRELDRNRFIKRVEFVTQKSRSKRLRLKHLAYQWKLWRAARASMRIVQLDGYLTDEAFIDAVQSVDILLVPYDAKEYAGRGSGIVLDGVMLCKPIVYSRGIGMTEFLTHGNAEAATTTDEFGTMVHKMLHHLPDYIAKTDEARQTMVAQLERTAAFLKKLETPCENRTQA